MTEVIVVGSGIIGLAAAVRLQQAGAKVTVVCAEQPQHSVSAVAAAVWYPTHTDQDPRIRGWARATFDELTRQALTGVPEVLLRPTRMLLRSPTPRLPWWAVGINDAAVHPAPDPYAGELRFTAPLVEMAPYLARLRERVVAAGGHLVQRPLHRLDDALTDAPVIVNATGLAAAALCGDDAVFPVRGDLVLVANPGRDTSVRDEDNPAGLTYVHPRRRDVVLGGTYEPGRWDTRPDPTTREQILRRCVTLVPQLAGAPVLGTRVGLRPARHGGPRVEAEHRAGGRIVHAYGHGAAGMTLSWGCADDITTLALDPR